MRTTLLALCLLAPVSLAAPALGPAAAQDPTPVDNRPEVKALCEEFNGHANKRGKQDQEAVGVIDRMLQEFPKCGPKDRAAIVKALDKCFNEKRQEDENGVPQNQLFIAATVALGEMAPESVPVLKSWIGHKTHRKDIKLQRELILKLGKTKHPAGREPLIDLLTDKEAQIIAAAAEALGEYAEIEIKPRKQTFEELLKVLMQAKGAVDSTAGDSSPGSVEARERYDTISAPIITSLQRLSGHDEHDPNEWQRWWNKNKKEDWDAK